jgi:hypothetical protein
MEYVQTSKSMSSLGGLANFRIGDDPRTILDCMMALRRQSKIHDQTVGIGPPINDVVCTMNRSCTIGCQECHQFGDFLRVPGSADGNASER